jgi:hypothetical protein
MGIKSTVPQDVTSLLDRMELSSTFRSTFILLTDLVKFEAMLTLKSEFVYQNHQYNHKFHT